MLAWFSLSLFYFIPVVFQQHIYPNYLIGDFTVFLSPAIFFLFFKFYPPYFFSERMKKLFIFFLIINSLLAPFTANKLWGSSYMSRTPDGFDPPNIMLLACLSFVFFNTHYFSRMLFSYLGILFFLGLSFLSQIRTNALSYLFLITAQLLNYPFLSRNNYSALKRLFLLILPFVVVLQVFLFSSFLPDLIGRKNRFLEIGTGDTSTLNRLNEAHDVVKNVFYSRNFFVMAFGFGHGACYAPDLSLPEPNLTEQNLVHNVHIFLFLVLFRYGLFGVSIFLYIACFIGRRAFFLLKSSFSWDFVMSFYFLFSLVNCLFRNIMIDPFFSIAAAYLLTIPGKRM